MKILSHIDMAGSQIRELLLENLAANPSTFATAGRLYYNTATQTLEFRNASAWISLGRLDQIEAPAAAVALNAQKITGLATPTADTDAATKAYADGVYPVVNYARVVTAETTATTTYVDLTTPGPSVSFTSTVACSVLVIVAVQSYVTVATAGAHATFAVTGPNPLAADDNNAAISMGQANLVNSVVSYTKLNLVGSATPNVFTMKYRVAGGATAGFSRRTLMVMPVR